MAVGAAIALVGTALASSYRTGIYAAGNPRAAATNPRGNSGPALQMSVRRGSFSVRVIRFPETCRYGSKTIHDYSTFISGSRASLTGKVNASGNLSGRYSAFDGSDAVTGHLHGSSATVSGNEQGPYDPASTVTPNECQGSYTFHAALFGG